jgi:hypothetical protein
MRELPSALGSPELKLNRQSARRLVALVVCFVHGKPLRDTGRFVAAVDRLPS